MNDIPLHLSHSSINIFADDTTLSASTHWTDFPSMGQDINSDLDDINEWSAQNRMIINTDKTKSILITGKRIENNLPSADTSIALAIKLDDTQIDQASCQKFLGVIRHEHLNYEPTLIIYVRNCQND